MTTPAHPESNQYKLPIKRPSLLTLIALISFGSIGAALFTPAIPQISEFFGVSIKSAQLTVTLYLIGYSVGQLLYAPIAKQYGRKPALYIGVTVSLVFSLLSALSGPLYHFKLLLYGRLFMALGSSVGLSLTFLIISDYFYEKHARKITAYAMLAFAVVPGISIAAGGFLVTYLGWESCFYFLTLYACWVLFLIYRLDETSSKEERKKVRFLASMKQYMIDFKNPLLLVYALVIGSSTLTVYVFAATAPVIVIHEMGFRPDTFGLFNLIPASGYFLGNVLAARLAYHFSIHSVFHLGMGVVGGGLLALFGVFWAGFGGVVTLFLLAFIVYLGIPLIYSNAAVLATFRSKNKPNASSIMSFYNMSCSVIGVFLIEILPGDLIKTMPALLLASFFVVISLYFLNYKRIKAVESQL